MKMKHVEVEESQTVLTSHRETILLAVHKLRI